MDSTKSEINRPKIYYLTICFFFNNPNHMNKRNYELKSIWNLVNVMDPYQNPLVSISNSSAVFPIRLDRILPLLYH